MSKPKGRLLLVEDDESLIFALRDRLESEGYDVVEARDGDSALEQGSTRAFDLIVLDVELPKKNGFDVCRDLRQRGIRTPILILTARSDVTDRVRGLRLGADDYLVKPFATMELVARIEALQRRVPAYTSGVLETYAFGDIAVDFRNGRITRNQMALELSKMELKLLRYLVENRGSVLSREELLEKVWGHATTLATRTVDVHIATLRQKLEENPSRPELIVTVHGAGYKFAV